MTLKSPEPSVREHEDVKLMGKYRGQGESKYKTSWRGRLDRPGEDMGECC